MYHLPIVDMNDVIWKKIIGHCFLLMSLLENTTSPWGQSWERVLHNHLCIHHSTFACAKPIPEIVLMVKLDIGSSWQQTILTWLKKIHKFMQHLLKPCPFSILWRLFGALAWWCQMVFFWYFWPTYLPKNLTSYVNAP